MLLCIEVNEPQTGLFSAAVAALLAVTIQDIRPNPQDTTAFYLASINQQLSKGNGIDVPIPTSLLSNPAASFTPPTLSLWVNGLWFLSLVISLTCALLATLLQQWARRYLRVTCPRYSPHKRARVRAFYAEGVEKLHLPWTVETLPILLHISLFLFFAGLSVFLFIVNLTIFKVVIAWVALCVIVYAALTFLPIFHKNSPYYAPLSGPVSFCITGLRYAFFWLLERFTPLDASCLRAYRSHHLMAARLDNFFSHSLRKTAEEFAFRMDSNIDYRALEWTFFSLDEDNELEKFFEGVPGFCKSQAVTNPLDFIKPNVRRLSQALKGLMDRTLTSNLVSEQVKQRRIIICTKVIEATTLLGPWYTLRRVLLGDWHGFLKSVEFGIFVQGLKDIPDITAFYAKCVVAVIISSVQERDERWFQLVLGQLKVSMSVARNHLAHRDSVLLASLIHLSRQTVEICSGLDERCRSHIADALSKTVESVCKLDPQRTLPVPQHDFCVLWNQLIDTAHDDKHAHASWLCVTVLKNIRKVYIALHEGTDVPAAFTNSTDDRDPILDEKASYPKCNIDEHRFGRPVPDLTINKPVDGAGNAATSPTVLTPASQYVPGSVPPFAFPHPSFYPHASTSAPSFPLPYLSGLFPVDTDSHGIAAHDGRSAQPVPSPTSPPFCTAQSFGIGIPPTTAGFDSKKDPCCLNAPVADPHICRKTTNPPPFDADTKLRLGMQAASASTPGSPLQDNKSRFSDSSGEDKRFSWDVGKTL
jgi:Family of unknown function (DUF6535)